jgi:hypothetical protein
MSAARRCGSRRPERAAVGDNGYVETDPTGRYGRVRMHVLFFFFFFAFSFSSFQLVIQYICMFLSRVSELLFFAFSFKYQNMHVLPLQIWNSS